MMRSPILKNAEMDQNLLILKKTVLGEITHLLTHRLPELKPLPSEVVADYKLLNFGHEKQISRKEHVPAKEATQLELLDKSVKKLTSSLANRSPISLEHIGVLCFLYRHVTMLHQAFQNFGVTYGQLQAFHGIQKEILIIIDDSVV
ncbi:hypothetical protein CRE_08363 [Caenorhabditis remanei]|uniref:Uncharacterized protein n=1 Tax=Caenorhabditis remanei TaxID=31234 RepID=E3MPN1_CAERE|nr:hypothetical protein CRE_08363 [Caenorhabditis remanei]